MKPAEPSERPTSDPSAGPDAAARVDHKCPTCGRTVPDTAASRPFCGERCKLADLNRWFSESYRVSRPIEQADLEEAD